MLTDKPNMPLILVVEDDESHAGFIQYSFMEAAEEYRLLVAATIDAAAAAVRVEPPALLLTDYRLPDGDGRELVQLSAAAWPVIMMTSQGNEQIAVEAMKAGALDYIVKSPETFSTLPRVVQRALREWSALQAEKQAGEALRESEEKFAVAFNKAPIMLTISSLEDGTYLDVNQRFVEVTGFSREEAIGRTAVELGWISESWQQQLRDRIQADGEITALELNLHARSGRPVLCKYWGELIKVAGRQRLLSIGLDITEHRHVEQQFLQSQKMEAFGRLAGGVAHDFNNLLGIILGYAQLVLTDTELSSHQRQYTEEILDAAMRSSAITGQLLSFAKRRPTALLDLNEAVTGLLNVLRRLMGEDVALCWSPADDLWQVSLDSAQLDQVMANLCINARDAVAGCGRVEIRTENVTFAGVCSGICGDTAPGDYVQLSVRDNGSGMDATVLENIFTPFYTTKEFSQGTGLGLATVLCIIRQHDGQITVESQPGQGTVFRLYLPAARGAQRCAAKEMEKLHGGSETILLVEDEPSLLQLGTNLLVKLGYAVLPADSPQRAHQLAAGCEGRIDLLITDVIMPGMNGRDLAEELLAIQPGMMCLFTSGYGADLLRRRGLIDATVCCLQKPFTLQTLADRVRGALQPAAAA